ncbi:MAG: hypothetical protein HRT38_14230 [Alteromonadaceae bacterium]|nr:hypothetical protein [Alteromonadaceae bacterium]
MIRILVINLSFMVSFLIEASPGIESVKLNEAFANELGFIIELSRDKEATTLNLTGPKEINGCSPLKGGNAILDENNIDIAVYISEIGKGVIPKSFGYIRNGSANNLVIFIDYICPSSRQNQSRRYELWSNST